MGNVLGIAMYTFIFLVTKLGSPKHTSKFDSFFESFTCWENRLEEFLGFSAPSVSVTMFYCLFKIPVAMPRLEMRVHDFSSGTDGDSDLFPLLKQALPYVVDAETNSVSSSRSCLDRFTDTSLDTPGSSSVLP